VARIDIALERSINGHSPEARVAARRRDIAPLVNDFLPYTTVRHR
jgi:hypothetical protein